MKRAFDILIAILILVPLLPVLLVVALLVRIFLGKPLLYTQVRPGLKNKPFKIYKFRSMLNELDDQGNVRAEKDRLTTFSKWLRSSSLDELPGLWNVLKGDMSLVGPRPLLLQYVPLYNETQNRRSEVRPGITGWAQINGRNSISWDEKFDLDVWYVDNHSLFLDIKILLLTIKKVVARDGISASDDVTMEIFSGNKNSSE